MREIGQDLRYSLRMMARNPGFTVVALAVLALGIGANSALFSIVNSVLLKPLAYPESERLVQVGRQLPQGRSDAVSPGQFLYWRDNNSSFTQMATYDGRGGGMNLIEGDLPERIPSIRVSTEFFTVLQAEPQVGRNFTATDGEQGAEKVAMISDGLWRRRFGADPSIVGRVLRLSGSDHTLIGVMARGFDFNTPAEIWTPLTLIPGVTGNAVYYVVARLQPDVSVEQARADMVAVAQRLLVDVPGTMADGETIFLRPHLEQVVGRVRPALMVLSGAVGLVLLIACANIANLLLARATVRRREIALRATLGAGRWRIVRQLLTESTLLAVLGALLGLLVARLGMSLLIQFRPTNLPRLDAIQVDATVFGFTMAIAVLTVTLFGLYPAIQASKVDLQQALKEGTGRTGSGRRSGKARGFLVVSEIALAMVLLVGASLLTNSFVRLTKIDPGYDYKQVLTMKMSFGGIENLTTAQFVDRTRRVIERLETSPGIEAAATISTLPLEHGLMTSFDVEGQASPDSNRRAGMAQWRVISPDYFRAMGIPILRGRTFDNLDVPTSEMVWVVNNALAAKYFPDEDPVGKRMLTGAPGSGQPPIRIVGVVGNISEVGLDRPPAPTVFTAATQAADSLTGFLANVVPTCWVVRTSGDPLNSANAVRSEILAVDPEQPVSNVLSMEQLMSKSIARRQFNVVLLTIFAGQALLLAMVGIYGVMSYSVAQRTHEIGVRLALGAARGETLRLILWQGMKLAIIGVVVGAGGAFGLTRWLSSLLYEISATDPTTFIFMALLLLLAAALACLGPALRATRVDPLVALRHE